MNPKYILLFGLMFTNWYGLYTQQPMISETVKPSVLALLIIYYYLETKLQYNADKLVIFGFFASMMGDIFLINSEKYFLLGLVSFAIAHISYIILLQQGKKAQQPVNKDSLVVQHILTLLLIIFAVFIGNYLYPEAEAEKIGIPVLVYITLIISMVISSLYRKNYTSKTSFYYGSFGAVIFTVSDLVLALGKFKNMNSPEQRVTVMVTYFVSQFLIYQAFKTHNKFVDSQKQKQK